MPTRGESQARAQAPDAHGARGRAVGPVQLRQVFFACCARGMTHEALALMARRGGSETSARALGKDVLVRGCGMVPGAPTRRTPWRSWRARLRGALSGNAPCGARAAGASGSIARALEAAGGRACGEAVEGGPPSGNPRETLAEAAEAAAAALYPGGVTGDESFWLVSDDDGRRRPADRRALRLWALVLGTRHPAGTGRARTGHRPRGRPGFARRVRADQLFDQDGNRRVPRGGARRRVLTRRYPRRAYERRRRRSLDARGLLRNTLGPRRRIGCGAA